MPRPSEPTRDLLRLYSLASHGEDNLARFLRERPQLVQQIGVPLDLERDDAELALQLAAVIGHHKRHIARRNAAYRSEVSLRAAHRLAVSARRAYGRIELDVDVLLGDLLLDAQKKYISFETNTKRIPVLRQVLVRVRAALRAFPDVAAFVDERGLHVVWRGGRGGLNLRPQVEERGTEVLHVDLRPAGQSRRGTPRMPVLLAEVLADLGLR